MSRRTWFQNDAFGRAQLIKKYEISREPSDMPGLTVTGLPGGGGWDDMVFVEIVQELGLAVRKSGSCIVCLCLVSI